MSEEPRGKSIREIDEVIADERAVLQLADREQATALCLSGGGIRSATFSLGVLQGLAKLGRLRHFHYLSTVSGGGYIGLWLATLISRTHGGVREVEDQLAASTKGGGSFKAGSNEPDAIKRLRAYSNFLSPVHGLSADSLSIAAICMRNLLLHWIMVLPLLFAVLLLPRVVNGLLHRSTPAGTGLLWWAAGLLFFLASAFASWDSSRVIARGAARSRVPSSYVGAFFVAPAVLGALLVVVADVNSHSWYEWKFWPMVPVCMLIQILGELAGRWGKPFRLVVRKDPDAAIHRDFFSLIVPSAATGAVAGVVVHVILYSANRFFPGVEERTTFAFPLVLIALGLANVVRAGVSMRWASEDVREWWGRASGLVGSIGLAWMALSMLVIQLPSWLLGWASTWSVGTAGAASVGSVLIAIATTTIGFWSKHGSEIKEKATGLSQTLGVRTMEVAAFFSVLTIALVASLLLGMAMTRWPFAYADELAKAKEQLVAKQECAVLAHMVLKKPEMCTQALSVCGVVREARSLPATCATQTPNAEETKPKRSNDEVPSVADAAAISATKVSTMPIRATTKFIESENFVSKWIVRHQLSLRALRWGNTLLFVALLVIFAFYASMLFGANAFSLNSFYGNRLTRAFLGASRHKGEKRPHPFTGFDRGDNLPLKDIAPKVQEGHEGARLLPIVNTALNLVRASGDRLEWQERKAASFFMSPYFCGSDVLGFVPTESYSSIRKGLSVGRAMAISGAAASPSMGYHSSPLVSLLLAFFNVRLGWWMPNPQRRKVRKLDEPMFGIGPIISELVSNTGDRTNFVYLSDGGHFENLGLYEMVRRRCQRIVVVDAGCDPKYEYEDLENAIRKIRVDFGIRIAFDNGLLRPEGARESGSHCCFGIINYAEHEELPNGEILYIKPVLTSGVSVDVRRYAESTRSNGRVFPQQPTSDQFFDEAQFESYRELGLHSVQQAFSSSSDPGFWPTHETSKIGAAAGGAARPPDGLTKESVTPRWAPTSEPKKPGGMLAALASIGPFGQAAMLASVTAAATVTGTVALKDPVVVSSSPNTAQVSPTGSTSQTEQRSKVPADELPSVATAMVDPNSRMVTIDIGKSLQSFIASSDPQSSSLRSGLRLELEDLLGKVEFNARIAALSPGSSPHTELIAFMSNAKKVVEDLRVASTSLKGSAGSLQQLAETIASLDRVAKLLEKTPSDLTIALRKINDVLDRIESKVQKISPRETVKGN